jgi:hypothetical protein
MQFSKFDLRTVSKHIVKINNDKKVLINRKFRVPRKQGAHFLLGLKFKILGFFLHQHEISDRLWPD